MSTEREAGNDNGNGESPVPILDSNQWLAFDLIVATDYESIDQINLKPQTFKQNKEQKEWLDEERI